MIHRSTIVVLVVLGLLHGCSCQPPVEECRRDADCASGLVCSDDKVCVPMTRCPSVPCKADEACASATGRCYAKNCATSMCGADQVCSSGSCIDLVCIGKSCAAGTTCIKGDCVPQSCVNESCLPAEVCIDGACSARTCHGVMCPAGQRCAGGTCYPASCGASTCAGSQVCVNGACVEDRCVGVTCPSTQRCASGQCLDIDCNGTACPMGRVCSSGTCVDALCVLVSCPTGYGCRAGLCAPQTADGGTFTLPDGGPVRFADGGTVGGGCRPSTCPEVACSDGIDNDNNGVLDCEERTCEALACRSTDACARSPLCRQGACVGSSTLVCDMPSGECMTTPGTCRPGGQSCTYAPRTGACDAGTGPGLCTAAGTCRDPNNVTFTYTPSNGVPMAPVGSLPPGNTTVTGSNTTVTFNSGTNTFTGTGLSNPPTVSTITLPNGQTASLLQTRNFDLGAGATLRLIGPNPVIIQVFGDATIGGTLDAAGHGAQGGAGSNPPGCGTAGMRGGNGTASAQSGGGGGGAGLVRTGASGASGASGGTGGLPGNAKATGASLAVFQGGCPGGNGGKPVGMGGLGGGGGGAVQLSASQLITVSGDITVNGGGGLGGVPASSGGGGAGSGGFIWLESPGMLFSGGSLQTNGGAGGQGASHADAGADGFDGLDIDLPAPGGGAAIGGNLNGGDGGYGGVYSLATDTAAVSAPTAGRPGFTVTLPDGGIDHGGGGGGGASPGLLVVRSPMGGECFPFVEYDRWGRHIDRNGADCP